MIEKIIPDKISFTLPTVFGEELTFLEFCGRVRAKLNECIDVVNDKTATIDQFTARIDANAASINTVSGKVGKNTTDIQKNTTNIQKNATAIATNTTNIQKNATAISANQSNIAALSGKVDKNTADIQQNTTDIQQNATAISKNESDIVKLSGAINNVSTQTHANTVNINTVSGKVDKNTTDIQQNATAISKNESDIVKLNGVINSVSVQTDENTIEIAENKESISTLNTSVEALRTDKVDKVEGKGLSTNDYTNKDKDILDKLSKKFELIEQFTLTEDVTQIYRNQKPNGEAYNFNDVILTLNIPIIEQESTEAYGGSFIYIVNSETDIANNRVVAQGGAFKKGQPSNISVRAKIEGGIVFGDYAASSGNLSNKQSAYTSYSNIGMLFAENITSILFTFFGQPIFSGTTIKIYAR